MIVFKTTTWDWDLTNKGISFTEKNNMFFDEQRKSFTFPFTEEITPDIADKLGLVTVDGVVKYKQRVYGYLIKDHTFYNAYLKINTVVGNRVELTIFYGKETLKVFDKELKDLPFRVTTAEPDLPTFAKAQLTDGWPTATHQFVKISRDDIATKSNYEHFAGFLNNYTYDDQVPGEWSFPVNTNEDIDGDTVAVNRNVMVPLTYLMEVLKIGFATEGLTIRGDFVNDNFNKKILLVPKNFMEKFAVSQYDQYSFSTYTTQVLENGQVYNVYTKQHTPTQEGAYSLKMRINFNSVIAQYFKLTVTQAGETLYEAESQNSIVNINETLDINILDTTVFDPIYVQLKLKQQVGSIADYNTFVYEYNEGALNVFPTVYTIADFLPDMDFRKFTNKIKTWFNLKFDYTENSVYINYIENSLSTMVFDDKRHLEVPKPQRILNTNNLFKLTYPNNEEVLVDKNGQTYNESDFSDDEIKKIEMDVLPLDVMANKGSITAIYPEDDEDLMFVLYDGPVAGENIAVNNINNRRLSLQHIYDNNYKNWLRFRANAETVKDSFTMHFTEIIDIEKGLIKYDKKHLIKSIKKKLTTEEHYKVDVESETF